MSTTTDLVPGDIRVLARSWDRSLRAQQRSPKTRQSYGESLRQLTDFLVERGMPTEVSAIRREHVEHWLADLGERRAKATCNVRYRGLQAFFKWAVSDGEITSSPMENMTPPAVPAKPVPNVDKDALTKLFKVCKKGGDDVSLRDTALILLLIGSGLRRGEVAGLRVEDVNLDHDEVIVTGKGDKVRIVPFGDRAGAAIDRYLRKARANHPMARRTNTLFLGPKGGITGSGIAQIVEKRCAQAGIPKINVHRFRHTFAADWLAQGGSEGDLMRLAGWSTRAMVDRYGAHTQGQRARDAYRRRQSLADRL